MAVARKLLVVLSWLFVLGIAVQFFLAGLAALGGESWSAHEAFGYAALHLFPVILLVVALIGRVPRNLLFLTIALLIVTFVQPFWVTAFEGEFLGAFHVLGALVIAALAHALAERATALSKPGSRVAASG